MVAGLRGSSSEAEAHEDGRGGVLEDHDDADGAEQAQTSGEQAGHTTGAEGNLQGAVEIATTGGSGGADVAANGEPHPEEADRGGEHATQDEGEGSDRTRLHEGEHLVALDAFDDRFLVDSRGGEEHHNGHRDHDHADRAELTLEVGEGAFLDGAGDLLHLFSALLLGEHATHEHDTEQ